MTDPGQAPDPFDDLLNLEEQFYDQGYAEGKADGAKAGRIEGRSVGMSQGFAKFVESGRLYGKALVWANRLPAAQTLSKSEAPAITGAEPSSPAQRTCILPPLAANPRLEKNVRTLYALVEPDTFSTENTDEAVDDFDDRVKRAQGKAKIVEKMVGESSGREAPKAAPTL